MEQYFPQVMFITLYKVVLTFESEDEILKCDKFYLVNCASIFHHQNTWANCTETETDGCRYN